MAIKMVLCVVLICMKDLYTSNKLQAVDLQLLQL